MVNVLNIPYMDPMEYVFPTMYTWIFQGVRFMDDI